MNTINIFFSLIYLATAIAAVMLYRKQSGTNFSQINISNISFSKIYTILLPAAIIVIGVILRLYQIGVLPAGLHQDEASIGYESYILSAFGLDRDGHIFPIYPITYGSGGGSPLMVYLNVLTTWMFGCGVVTLRMLPAVLGFLTLPAFYCTIRILSADEIKRAAQVPSVSYVNGEYLWMPLVSLSVLTFCPWHIMLSRWSLDSNTTPFFVSMGLLFFALGAYFQKDASSFESIGTLFSGKDRKKMLSLRSSDLKATLLFSASAIMYSLCLYSYGSTTIIIPIHLIIICIFCIKTGRMNISQMLLGIVLFVLFAIPLILFYAVNYLGLPEIYTPYFSVNSFTASRSVFASGSGFFLSIIDSFVTMIKNFTFGNSKEQIMNYIPGFAPLFSFTFPLTLLGIIVSFNRVFKDEIPDVFMCSLFVPSFIFGLFVEEDINRMIMLFIPIVYYLARGFVFAVSSFVYFEKKAEKKAAKYGFILCKSIAPALFFVGASMFIQTYFIDYNSLSSEAFMAGYGDACSYANDKVEDGSHIYSTYEHVSAPFMVALYYTKTPPMDFVNTVHYKDPDAEFRIADSFGSFIFGLPEDMESDMSSHLEAGDIFILHNSQLDNYEFDGYEVSTFSNFSVLIPAKE